MDRVLKAPCMLFYLVFPNKENESIEVRLNTNVKICPNFKNFITKLPLQNRCIYEFVNKKLKFSIEFVYQKEVKDGEVFMSHAVSLGGIEKAVPPPVKAEPVHKKRGFFGRLFGGEEEEEKKIEDYRISGPIKKEFKHVQGISKEEDLVMSFNVEVDTIKMAKDAMKAAGFKKKDMDDPVFMK